MQNILVTGGAGFIGSHTVVELIEQGYVPIIVDNMSNSSERVLERVAQITQQQPTLIKLDIRDTSALRAVFSDYTIDSVIHFAGLKAVGESVEKPITYYQNNVEGSLSLLYVMKEFGCQNLVFSSSATVYGDPHQVPITECFPLSATNPYGQSKLMVEHILRDCAASDQNWNIAILRYFNPVAAHPSGLIGENPRGIPNNLMPYIAQVAVGRLPHLSVFGNDYDTRDGTGVRDYIHVVDLARAHLKSLRAISKGFGCREYNIGTGVGYSVMEMVKAFERASNKKIKVQIVARRAGDVAQCYADSSLSARELGWEAEYNLMQMMRDQWRWQSNNPNGYET